MSKSNIGEPRISEKQLSNPQNASGSDPTKGLNENYQNKNSTMDSSTYNSLQKDSTSDNQRLSMKSNALEGVGDMEYRYSRFGSVQMQRHLSQSKPPVNGLVPGDNGLTMINGNMVDNKLEGTGRLNSEDYVYYGQWSESKFNGYGRITKRNFALYEGQFSKNKREGLGVEIYVNSDIYIGEFKADKKSGLGIYLFSTGGYYYGFFDKNFRDGFGTLYNRANRQTYTGFWKSDLRHGRGIEFYKNGSKYDGFFENDKRHGVGFMEYSKSLLYIGEWSAGKRDGLGKVEHNKKTVSGRFKADQFVEPFFFNSSNHADILLNNTIPKTVEEFLKQTNYKLKKVSIRGIGDIYAVLKESLVSYVLSLVESSILRLNCYLKLKNIFSKSSRFEYVMDDIVLTLKYEPNPGQLTVCWDPALIEILIGKHDFSWQKWDLDVNTNKVIFDESQKGNESTDIQFKKNEENIQLTITNELAIAKTSNLEGEGVLNNDGFQLRYYEKNTSEWQKTALVRIFPFFLVQEDSNEKSIFALKLDRYVGEFYFGQDKTQPRNLNMFFALDQESIWYSVGLDTVGSFVTAGRLNRATSSGQLLQKYFLEYQIEYELFLATSDKLQGLWKTTNMGGHFVLRKDTSFRFTNEIAKALYEVIEKEKNGPRVAFEDIELLRSYMESSILSVIMNGAQGGIPEFLDKKEEEEDSTLFEKYKKQIEPEASPALDFSKKGTLESPVIKKESRAQQINIGDEINRNEDYKEVPGNEEEIIQKSRASLAFLNLKAIDKVATQELQDINTQQNIFAPNDFQAKLSSALRGLKQVVSDSIKFSQYKFDRNTENISWVGNFVTLGKEQQIVFDNLYIIGSTIEGIFTDADDISYELAGSYSLRTKEFEVVGMSFDKTKSIKIKGELTNFKLKGIMTKKPMIGPSSNVNIKLLGHEGKALLRFFNDNTTTDYLDFVLKVTDDYLYGMLILDKDYVFLNGIKDKGGMYGLAINTHNKKIKNNILMQVRPLQEEKERMSSFERKFIFKNEDLEMTFFY